MTVRLGDTAPDFTAETTQGTISFHEWLGDSWGVLFSHPKDFTPVCTTELGYVARIKPDFDKRNVKVIGLSVDPVDSHVKWEADIAETQGTPVNFPMIGDGDKKVSNLYEMIHPNASDTMTVRSVFIIGPDKKIKLSLTYPASTGRNFDEILRVIDSLQLTAKFKVATPANWVNGGDVIIGAAVSEFFVSSVALLFLIYTIIYKDWFYYKKKIFIILIIFFIYIVFVSLLSEFPINSLKSSLFYFRFYLMFLAIWFLLDHNKNFPKYFLLSIIFHTFRDIYYI